VSPNLGGAYSSGIHQARFNARWINVAPKTSTVVRPTITTPTAKPSSFTPPKTSPSTKLTGRGPSLAAGPVGGSITSPFDSDVESTYRPGEYSSSSPTPKFGVARMNTIKPVSTGQDVGRLVNGVYRPPTPSPSAVKSMVAPSIVSPIHIAPVIAPIRPAPAPQPQPQPVVPVPVKPVVVPAEPRTRPSEPIRTPAQPDKPRTAPIIPLPDEDPEPEKIIPPKTVPFVPPVVKETDPELVDRMEKEIDDIDKQLNRDSKPGDPIIPPIDRGGPEIAPDPPIDDDDKPVPFKVIPKPKTGKLPDHVGSIDACLRLATQYGRFGVIALRGVDDNDPCLLLLLNSLGVTSKEALRRSI